MRKRFLVGSLTAVLVAITLSIPLEAQTFTAELQNFWNQLRTGGLVFQTLKTVNATCSGTCTGFGGGGATIAHTTLPIIGDNAGNGLAAVNLQDLAYAQTGVDINTSFQVTATHLASALPVAQGGTALTAFTRTGNTTLFATSTGSLTSGNCIKSDASGNLIDSGGTCGGSPGGSTRQYQYNNAGAFAGDGIRDASNNNVGLGPLSLANVNTGTAASNTAFGYGTLNALTTASNNTAFGDRALNANTSGASNVAIGLLALFTNTTGSTNVAVGTSALRRLTTASDNVLIGASAGSFITTGQGSVGIGSGTLGSLVAVSGGHVAIGLNALTNFIDTTSQTRSVGIGYNALTAATTGYGNAAVGDTALGAITTGFENVGIGATACSAATTMTRSVCIGKEAASGAVITGDRDVIIGEDAGNGLTSGSFNVLLGIEAGSTASPNVAITTAANNVLLGYRAGMQTATLTNIIAIGSTASAIASNTAVIGNGSITDTYLGSTTPASNLHALTLYPTGSGLAVANVGAGSCGTTAATVVGNNNVLVITVGATAGTQCRVAFSQTAATEWDCAASDETSTIATRASAVDATHTDVFGAFGGGDKVTMLCFPR